MRCISLKLLIVSVLLNLLSMPISSMLAVIFGYMSWIFGILLPFELMRYNKRCINKKQFVLIFILVAIVYFNSLISLFEIQTGDIIEVAKVLSSFFMFLVAIAAKDITYAEKDLKFYFKVIRLFAIVMFLYTIIPFDFQYTVVNEYGKTKFTLSMGNPNATATKLLFCIVALCIENGILKSTRIKISNYLAVAGLLYTILMLGSRTALLCAVIFIIYTLALKFRIKKWMTRLVWIIPLIFIPIQLVLPDIYMFGKTLASGRETLYAEFFDLIKSSPIQFILGDFAKYQLANNHNIIFTLIFNVGFVGLFLFFYFWRIESSKCDENTTKTAQYAWMGWIVFVVHSMAESAAMSGALTFGAIVIWLIRLAKDKLILSSLSESRYNIYIQEQEKEKGVRD